MMETTLILASIAQQFQLDLLPGYPVEPHPLITLRLKHGMPMIVKKQSS
jgi:cytochrome P450